MTTLSAFFQGSDSLLGTFYPNHYLIAVFRSLQAAESAIHKLRLAGFAHDDGIAAGGREVIALSEEKTALGGFLMQGLSRFLATEQIYADQDRESARHGAGFLAVHCRTEVRKQAAWAIIQPEAPLDARYYGSGGIEHLAGDFGRH